MTLKANQHLLLSRKGKVIIYTDHRNLFLYQKFKITRLPHLRWMEILSEGNFCIKFIDGVNNSQADAISRPNIMIEENAQTPGKR
jgi:hypothetical protein